MLCRFVGSYRCCLILRDCHKVDSLAQAINVTCSHSRKIFLDPLNRTKVYNVGSRVKIEGANNMIYCELQHVTFVIPKNTTSNDTNTAVSPPSSRRATIVRSIAEQLPPQKTKTCQFFHHPLKYHRVGNWVKRLHGHQSQWRRIERHSACINRIKQSD